MNRGWKLLVEGPNSGQMAFSIFALGLPNSLNCPSMTKLCFRAKVHYADFIKMTGNQRGRAEFA